MGKYSYLLPLILFVTFASILPMHIQGGDTAELVNASSNLFVSHPPGYPLFIWTQHFWLKLFTTGTEFWRASLLSLIFGISTLFLLMRHKFWWSALLILVLGTFSEFVESSVLPDVFSLHGMLVGLFLAVYLFGAKNRQFLIPFLFFFSASNHHTTIFLLPCLVQCFMDAKPKTQFFMGMIAGILTTSLLYFSLLYMHPEHPDSWGHIIDFPSLVSHILRADYGTFKLTSGHENHGFEPFFYLLKSLAPLSVTFILVVFLAKDMRDKKFYALTMTLLLVLLFPLAMNISADFVGQEILRRFHLMPLVVLFFWFTYVVHTVLPKKKELLLFSLSMVPALLINIHDIYKMRFLRTDSVIEDHSLNLIKEARKFKPIIIVSESDSSYFALRYLLKGEKDIAVVSLPLLFHEWFQSKIQSELPSFTKVEKVWLTKNLAIESDLIRPNIDHVSFLFLKDFYESDWYKLTYLPLGRLIQKGSGVEFQDIPLKISDSSFSWPQFETKNYLFYQYSYFYMAQAHFADTTDEKIALYKKTLQIVPYALPAAKSLCELTQARICSKKNLEKMEIRNKYMRF